jgi:hypothetical protein
MIKCLSLVNKAFSALLLTSLKDITVGNPFLLGDEIYDFIAASCIELRRLVINYRRFEYRTFSEIGLQLIGVRCKKLEELVIDGDFWGDESSRCFMSSFSHVRSLTLTENETTSVCHVLPPPGMSLWSNLTRINGNMLCDSNWQQALSQLPCLQSLSWIYGISDTDVQDFCLLCANMPIALTVQELELEAQHTDKVPMSDLGLCIALDTFLNLRKLTLRNTSISLTTEGIAQRIGRLKLLESLCFNITFYESTFTAEYLYTWLETNLSFLPKSLREVKLNEYIWKRS